MIQKCVITLNKNEKAMPFMNFKKANAKNVKMKWKKLLKYGICIY